MVRNRGFCTKLLGDVDLEGMIILLCYEDQVIAEINYEKGIDKMEIEIVPSLEGAPERTFSLAGFLGALEDAKQLAIKCAREDQHKI